jgi:hypothetical protein
VSAGLYGLSVLCKQQFPARNGKVTSAKFSRNHFSPCYLYRKLLYRNLGTVKAAKLIKLYAIE